jgi:sugar transferase EpsL
MLYKNGGKRFLDVILAILALVLLSPLWMLLVVLIALAIGRPVLFRQDRPGLYGKPFTAYKFRTMSNARDLQGKLLSDEERLTSFGKVLRSASLDELPSIFNIIKGEMSWVGPRPLLMEYLDLYTPEQKRRHQVKPGITGWAQVNGRNAIAWEEKFAYDIWYVNHQSLELDLKIIALTISKILKREGITQPGQATMERYKGGKF